MLRPGLYTVLTLTPRLLRAPPPRPWPRSVTVGEEPIGLDRGYSVVTKAYLALGKDGYTVFDGAPVIHDAEECPMLPTLVHNHFRVCRVLEKWGPKHDHVHAKGLTKAVHKFKALLSVGSGCCDGTSPLHVHAVVEGRIREVSRGPGNGGGAGATGSSQ